VRVRFYVAANIVRDCNVYSSPMWGSCVVLLCGAPVCVMSISEVSVSGRLQSI